MPVPDQGQEVLDPDERRHLCRCPLPLNSTRGTTPPLLEVHEQGLAKLVVNRPQYLNPERCISSARSTHHLRLCFLLFTFPPSVVSQFSQPPTEPPLPARLHTREATTQRMYLPTGSEGEAGPDDRDFQKRKRKSNNDDENKT